MIRKQGVYNNSQLSPRNIYERRRLQQSQSVRKIRTLTLRETPVALRWGVLLAASQLAYTAVCWAGAAYLLCVGYRMLRHPRTSFSTEARAGAHSDFSAFGRGALTNLLNPKVGVFYVSFLPQFVPHGVRVASFVVLLGVIHSLLGLIWFACLIVATRPISQFLRRPRTVLICDRITGAVFVSFGLKLVFDSRALVKN